MGGWYCEEINICKLYFDFRLICFNFYIQNILKYHKNTSIINIISNDFSKNLICLYISADFLMVQTCNLSG